MQPSVGEDSSSVFRMWQGPKLPLFQIKALGGCGGVRNEECGRRGHGFGGPQQEVVGVGCLLPFPSHIMVLQKKKKTDLRGNWFAETNHICPESMVTNVRDPWGAVWTLVPKGQREKGSGTGEGLPQRGTCHLQRRGRGNKEPTILQIR